MEQLEQAISWVEAELREIRRTRLVPSVTDQVRLLLEDGGRDYYIVPSGREVIVVAGGLIWSRHILRWSFKRRPPQKDGRVLADIQAYIEVMTE